jgi:uncharacterized Zn finger protein
MNRLGAGAGPQQPKTTQGQINRVPCPHCGKPQDFRELQQAQLLDTGHQVVCEECGRLQTVTAIRVVTIVVVRPDSGMPRNKQADARPATTVAPSALQRLGRGRK